MRHDDVADSQKRLGFRRIFVILGAMNAGTRSPAGALLYEISIDRTWGFINADGEVVIPPRFSEVGRFSEGLVAVRLATEGERSEESGFINAKGDFVIGPGVPAGFKFPKYQNSYSYGDFHEGRARLWIGDSTGCGGYIDRTGKLVIPAKFARASEFSEGLACVSLPRPDGESFGPKRAGFIDPEGRFVIPPDQDFIALKFSDGRCVISCTNGDRSWSCSVIDRQGNVILPPGIYSSISLFEGGLARVVKDGKVGCIDTDGNVVVPVEFDQLWEFGAGEHFTTGTKNGRSYIVDQTGQCVRELDLGPDTEVVWLRHGMVMVESGGKRGFIDLDGCLRIPIEFDNAENFNGTLAYAQRDGWKGYINRNGEFVWKTDRWDGPSYKVKAPLSDFLPPGTVEALPLDFRRTDAVNAIIFATSDSLDAIGPWLNEAFGDRFGIWDDSPLPDNLVFDLCSEGISVKLQVCDATGEEAGDFASYHASDDLIMLLEKHQPSVIGLLLLEEGPE
jgi:hypothetical protein